MFSISLNKLGLLYGCRNIKRETLRMPLFLVAKPRNENINGFPVQHRMQHIFRFLRPSTFLRRIPLELRTKNRMKYVKVSRLRVQVESLLSSVIAKLYCPSLSERKARVVCGYLTNSLGEGKPLMIYSGESRQLFRKRVGGRFSRGGMHKTRACGKGFQFPVIQFRFFMRLCAHFFY